MEIVKAATTSDFLAMVPALAGCRVDRSIVFVPFRGNRTLGGVCRIDLPTRDRRADVRTIVHGALGILSRMRGVDRVDVVVYTDRTFASERGLPYLDLGRAAVGALRRAGFDIGLAACVAPDGWGDYLDHTHQPVGKAISDITTSEAAAASKGIAQQDSAALDRDVPDAELAARSAVGRILGFEPTDPNEELVYIEREMPLVDLFEVVLSEYREPVVIALALTMFESPSARDGAILYYAFGREVDTIVDEAMATGEATATVELSDLLLGRTERIPDRARLGEAITMLRTVIAHSPDELRPGPLTMLAWCLWAVGSTAAAGAMLDRVATLAPDYRMAALMRTWIDAGALPDWLFARLE